MALACPWGQVKLSRMKRELGLWALLPTFKKAENSLMLVSTMLVSTATRRLGVLGLLLVWCSFLIVLRVHRAGSSDFIFLWWNLFLAFVPLAASAALKAENIRRRPAVAAVW